MADSRALTIQSGQVQQIANADALIVGDGILTPATSGNDLTLTPDGTFVIVAVGKTLDASTIDSVGSINIGGTNSTGVSIGRSTVAVSMPGNLSVTEGITSIGLLDAQGNVDLGNAITDTISMTGHVDTDINFTAGAARDIQVDKSADDVGGSQLRITSGEGGDNPTVVGRGGGTLFLDGGDGGAGTGAVVSGAGAAISMTAGDAGPTGGAGVGAGGNVTIDAGVGGTNGVVNIGTVNASALTIGRVGVTTTVAGALTVAGVLTAQSTTQFQQSATFQGDVTLGNDPSDTVNFGAGAVTATGNPTWDFGTGQVDFGGNVDANAGLDVSGGAFTFTGTNFDLDPTGTFTLDMDAGQTAQINISDNQSSAFYVRQGLLPYLDINTTTAAEAMTFGNTTDNPSYAFLGSGTAAFSGDISVGGIPITQSGDALILAGGSTTESGAVNSLTTLQRTALTGVNGMITYDSDIGSLYAYTGGSWSQIASGGASPWQESSGIVSTTNTSWDVIVGGSATLGTERLRVIGDVGIQGDIDFETGSTRTVQILTAADETPGNQLSVLAGAGGPSVGGAAGGAGGDAQFFAGAGGAGDGTNAAGAGGSASLRGGAAGVDGVGGGATGGGASVLGGVGSGNSNGGGVTVAAGSADLAGGSGNGGATFLEGGAAYGTGNGGIVQINGGYGNGANADGGRVDLFGGSCDSAQGGQVRIAGGYGGTGAGGGIDMKAGTGATAGSIDVGSGDTAAITLGNATDNTTITQVGTGQVTFTGNVDATAGLDVTTAALTAAAGLTVSGGAIDLDPTGNVTVDMDTGQTFDVTFADTQALGAVSFNDGTVAYLEMGEVATEEQIVTDVYFGMDEVASAPTAVTDRGFLYTKADAGVTQLFYTADDGTEYQLTPSTGGTATQTTITKTANEAIAAGAPVVMYNNGGSPEFREADANDAARDEVIGLAAAAITATSSGDAVLCGEVDVPDAQWISVPGVADVGAVVYLSNTVGSLSITAPTPPSTVVRVGWVTQGGTGAVKVAVNVGTPTRTV
jgi:hypothetical protein